MVCDGLIQTCSTFSLNDGWRRQRPYSDVSYSSREIDIQYLETSEPDLHNSWVCVQAESVVQSRQHQRTCETTAIGHHQMARSLRDSRTWLYIFCNTDLRNFLDCSTEPYLCPVTGQNAQLLFGYRELSSIARAQIWRSISP